MLISLVSVFVLLIAFQLKHYICDYPLQGTYMLGKFNKVGWLKPLASHALVHAIGTFIIVLLFNYNLWLIGLGLAALDFVIHFIVDKIKVEKSRNVTTSDAKFWHYLGLDQSAHHLTHYLIIFILVLL